MILAKTVKRTQNLQGALTIAQTGERAGFLRAHHFRAIMSAPKGAVRARGGTHNCTVKLSTSPQSHREPERALKIALHVDRA